MPREQTRRRRERTRRRLLEALHAIGIVDVFGENEERDTDDGTVWRARASVRAILPAAITVPLTLLLPLVLFPVAGWVTDPETAVGVVVTLFANWLVYIVSLLVALWVAIRIGRGTLARYGLAIDRRWLTNFGVGIAISLAAVGTSLGYGVARGYYVVSPGRVTELFTPGLVLVVVVGVAVFYLLQNVYEELVFRGIVLQNLAEGLTARGYAPAWAVPLATAGSLMLFGVFHLPLRGGFVAAYSMVVGIPFALAYLVTGRLGLAIGVHFGRLPVELLLGAEFGPVELPTVATMTGGMTGMLETTIVQLGGSCLLVLVWAALTMGHVGVADRVYLSTAERG